MEKSYTHSKRVTAFMLALLILFGCVPGNLLAKANAATAAVTFSYAGNTYSVDPGQSGSGVGIEYSLGNDEVLTLRFTGIRAGNTSEQFVLVDGTLKDASVTVIGGGAGGSAPYGTRKGTQSGRNYMDGAGGNGGGGGSSVTQNVTIDIGAAHTIVIGAGGEGGHPDTTDVYSLMGWAGKNFYTKFYDTDARHGKPGKASSWDSIVADGGIPDTGGSGGIAGLGDDGFGNWAPGSAGTGRDGGGGGIATYFSHENCGTYTGYGCFICGTCSETDTDHVDQVLRPYGLDYGIHAKSYAGHSYSGGAGAGGGGNGGTPGNEHCNNCGTNGADGGHNTGGGGGGGAIGVKVYETVNAARSRGAQAVNDETYYETTGSGIPGYYPTSGGNGGSGVVILSAKVESNGTLNLMKTSANTGVSNGNSCYSLNGAVYGVYKTQSDANNKTNAVATLTTNASGVTETVEVTKGTYYIRELTAPPGFALDTQTYTVTVEPNKLCTVPVQDNPITDPVNALLKKTDAATGTGTSSGTASLAGAEFTFKFYPGQYATAAAAEASGSPQRKWTFKTDSDGFILFDASYLVSGDTFWTAPNGDITLPLGTVVVQETKAPEHYIIDSTKFVVHITEDGTDQNFVETYNTPTRPNTIVRGGVSVDKKDSVLTSGPQGEATLQGAVFSIINNNDTPVFVNGKSYDKGKVVATITTDANGHAQSATDLLPFGSYTIKETTAPTGYALNTTWSETFSITDADNNKRVVVGPMTDEVLKGKLTVQKADAETKLHTPQGDGSFAGATFDIVNASTKAIVFNGQQFAPNAVVTTITTNANGVASVSNLPYGKYKVVEKSIPGSTGYTVNSSFGITVTVNGTGNYTGDDCLETVVIHGGVQIAKVDAETGTSPQGNATLKGAVFSIVNASAQGVYVNGKLYAVGQEVATATTDASGIASLGTVLPIGTYTVKEKTPSAGYLLNPNWSKTIQIRTDGQIVKLEGDDVCPETPISGGLQVQKVDAVTGQAAPEGNAKLSGAKFEVTNASAKSIVYNGNTVAPGAVVATISTNANGLATIASGLPYGTYTVKEVAQSEGYLLNSDWSGTVTITTQGKVEVLNGTNACPETPIIGGVKMLKIDALLNNATAEGDATLKGAVFQIVNASTNPITYNGTSVASGAVVTTITTDDKGAASLETGLPYGSYKITEKTPSTGYLLNPNWVGNITITENGQVVDIGSASPAPETPIRGGVSVQKLDKDTGTNHGAGGVEMYNAEFTIINRSSKPVVVNGVTVNPFVGDFNRNYKGNDGVAMRIYTNHDGFATTGARDLPYGTYEIYETHQPNGYLRNDNWVKTFTVTQDGVITAFDNADACIEELARVDVHFRKINALTGKPIANVPFRVTNLESGESHIIVTDPNGVYDSSYIPHTQNTNGNDAAVSGNTVDESLLDFECGTWFGGGTPMDTLPDGSHCGAFVYGNYKFEELRCTANEGLRLVEPEFFIYAKNSTMDLGDLEDYVPEELETNLHDADSGTHYCHPATTITLYDTVVIHNAVVGREYTIEATLMEKATGNPLCDASGNPITATYKFTAIGAELTLTDKICFTFDASLLTGSPLVAFEKLTNGAELVYASHEDINDEDQTVYFPAISTTATGVNGSKFVANDKNAVITDTVHYENFAVGKTIELQATLMDKSTGKPVVDENGSPIVASTTFVPTSTSGDVDVKIVFDSTRLLGKTLVCFERAYLAYTGMPLASHEDIDDEAQTVTILKLGTVATGEKDAIVKSIPGAPNTVFHDRVDYAGLFPGNTYTVSGVIYDKATNAPLVVNGLQITATATFTPDTPEGSVWLDFELNSSGLEGKTLVAFEYLHDGPSTADGIIAKVDNIDDLDETVYIPEIHTTATTENGSHLTGPTTVTINDEVFYSNLVAGQEYKVEGELISKTTGNPLTDANGQPYTAEKTFTPDKPDGSIIVTFVVDASALVNDSIVAFETLNYKAPDTTYKFLTEHKDPDDEDQTVNVVDIHTVAKSEEGDKLILAGENAKIIDTISYSNFIPGKQYELRANLMDKTTGEFVVDANGNKVEARKTFTADSASGSVDMEIVFDATIYPGATLVVYEYAYDVPTTPGSPAPEKPFASHEDINDADQTIFLPKIGTVASNEEGSEGKAIAAAPDTVFVDRVDYELLVGGNKYIVKGVLHDPVTGAALLDANGVEYNSSVEFIADPSGKGSVYIPFTIDSSEMTGKSIVVYEYLYTTATDSTDPSNPTTVPGKLIADFEDVNDLNETVYIPEIHTTATTEEGSHYAPAKTGVVVNDEVFYENLFPGQEYQMEGTLMDKETGTPLLNANGDPYTVSMTFTPDKPDGSIIVTFVVDASDLGGKDLVAFETLNFKALDGTYKFLTEHKDPDDEEQTIHVADLRTIAKTEEGDKFIFAGPDAKVIDTISYSNFVPGKEYIIRANLVDKATGNFITDAKGKKVEAQKTFKPKEASGTVDMEIIFDATNYPGVTMVVYEYAYDDYEEPFAFHEDIEDEDQTIYCLSIGTVASNEEGSEGKAIPAAPDTEFVDRVDYENLIPGNTYILEGELRNAENGEPITDKDGNTITATLAFTPDSANGSEYLHFTLDSTGMDGMTIVCFERLYTAKDNDDTTTPDAPEKVPDKLLAVVEDIDDLEETVYIPTVRTTAMTDRGSHTAPSAEEVIINDEVFYTNLFPGQEYRVEGNLVGKDGEPLLNANGEPYTAFTDFVPEEADGSIILTFIVDTTALGGMSAVVFETLEYKDLNGEYVFLTEHADPEDEDQTIRVPEILTNAATIDDIQTVEPKGDIEIRDTVHVTNAVIGSEYIFRGMLMNEQGEALELQPVEVKKVAEENDFDVVLTFTVNAAEFGLAGKHVTVFERMFEMQLAKEGEGTGTPGEKVEVEVAQHTELQDEDQTIWLPEIKTTATGADGEKFIEFTDIKQEVTVLDTVLYTGLKPGQEYTVTGTLMNKTTGEPVLATDGKTITATETFTPDTTDGSVVITFKFRGEFVAGKSVVAFERMMQDGIVVAVHEDINDPDQTVEVSGVGLIYKYNATTEKGLPGAVITVTDLTTKESFDVTTDADGYARFGIIPGHQYSYKEKAAPDGFQLNPNEYNFSADADGNMSEEAKLLNMWNGTIVLSKVDAITNAPVPGALIAVYKKNGNDFIELFRQRTDEFGRIYFYPDGMVGTFYYKELEAPDGYYLDDEMHSFNIAPDMTVTGQTKFTNAPNGCVVLKKVSENGDLLQGAKFAVYTTDGTLITTDVTDEYGRIYFVSPGPGSYYFVELEAPKGYIRTDAKIEFSIDPHGNVYGTNKLVNKGDGSPSTGDTRNADRWLYGMIGSTAVAAAGAGLLLRKKKENDPAAPEAND